MRSAGQDHHHLFHHNGPAYSSEYKISVAYVACQRNPSTEEYTYKKLVNECEN